MSERERFEAWAQGQGLNLARFDRYRYADNETKAAWAAWQVATAPAEAAMYDRSIRESHGYKWRKKFVWIDE